MQLPPGYHLQAGEAGEPDYGKRVRWCPTCPRGKRGRSDLRALPVPQALLYANPQDQEGVLMLPADELGKPVTSRSIVSGRNVIGGARSYAGPPVS
jgi:hypothetical protein